MVPLTGAAVEAAIEAEIDVVSTIDGPSRWRGQLLGAEGGTFQVTQAFGDRYAVGAIKTAQGECLLEAKDGLGWVVELARVGQGILPAT